MRKFYLSLGLVVMRFTLQAQLPVDREPHHKVVLENAYVRVLEGRVRSNDTTAAHIHAANSVVVFLSSSTFGIETIGDKPVITAVHPGDLKYAPYGDKPVNHIVWNQGPGDFHFLVVELAPHRQVDTSRFDLDGGQTRRLEAAPVARVLIVISGSVSVGDRPVGAGQVKFLLPNTLTVVSGSGTCVVLTIH